MSNGKQQDVIVCAPRKLPRDLWEAAADIATEINPVNHPPLERLAPLLPGFAPTRENIAVLTTKYWHSGGVELTMGFLKIQAADLQTRMPKHINARSTDDN